LRSFYEQNYPGPLEVIFASEQADDPGIQVARQLAAQYPRMHTRFVVARSDFGLNPKVCTMQGGLQAALHELVLQSDANVRLHPDHLCGLVREMIAEQASLIGSLVIGAGEQSIGATLENLQLTTFTAPGVCAAEELGGVSCVLGKTMLFRRAELDAMGGLARVKDVLAEDFALCTLYARHKKRVVLSKAAVANINEHTSLQRFLGRHSRWLKMRAVVSAGGFAADLGSNPLPFALAAWLASGLDARLGCALLGVHLYKCWWDAQVLRRFRGHGLGLHQLWATPARDLSMAAVWCYALLSRTTVWRGRRLRLGPGSVLLPDDARLPLRLLRRVGLFRPAK
jgi:ceramide glucosyltransferase